MQRKCRAVVPGCDGSLRLVGLCSVSIGDMGCGLVVECVITFVIDYVQIRKNLQIQENLIGLCCRWSFILCY